MTSRSSTTTERARRQDPPSAERRLPTKRPPTHPGEILLEEFLEPAELSQAELARRLGKTPAAINELVKGKRGVSAEMAWLLAKELRTTPDFWMNLQTDWDLWHAREALRKRKAL